MNASQAMVDRLAEVEQLSIDAIGTPRHGLGRFFKTHGVAMDRKDKLPKGTKLSKMANCYANSSRAAERFGLLYAEGFAWHPNAVRPMPHAWCFDLDTLRVIDPTWEHGCDYFGIVFRTDWVERVGKATGYSGIIGNFLGDVNDAW